MRLFGTSGIRGIADKNLLQLAFKVGLAVGAAYENVAVAGDPRTSSEAIQHSVISGLLAAGARCSHAGTAPTPTLAFITRQFSAGVMVTASHNPPEYNGMKLVNPDGSAFSPAQQAQVEEAILGDLARMAPWRDIKSSLAYSGAIEQHIERIQRDFSRSLKLKVVVDAGCGAASLVTPYLLQRMGCQVTALDCYPSGFFPREVEPVQANLGNLMRATLESGADLGIAHDGDADRMMAVDRKGRFIPGDKLLIILARAVGAREVVTTTDASMIIEESGFKVRRTPVGDNYVSEELKGRGDFGGEPSGAWVFPGMSLCPDGIYAAARLAAIAAEKDLSAMIDALPAYPILRGSVASHGVDISGLEAGLMALKPVSVDKVDGVKLSFTDGWLLVRPSGTEPKIRLTAEARTESGARQLYDSGVRVVTECRKTVAGRSA